jgi:hypothetical protein
MRTPELQIRYILKKGAKNVNKSTIAPYLRYDGQRVFITTRKIIDNDTWDDYSQIVLGNSHSVKALNDYLDLLKSKVIRILTFTFCPFSVSSPFANTFP